MTPDRYEKYLEQLEPPAALDATARQQWRAEARQQLLALAAAYEELGQSPEEALRSALRQLARPERTAATPQYFPRFRSLGRWARACGRRLVPVTAVTLLLLLLGSVVANEIAGRALERELAAVRAQGAPLTLAEAAPPEIPEAENAAVVYAQAFEQLARVQSNVLRGGQKRLGADQASALREYLADRNETPSATLTATIRTLLADTTGALERARAAAAMPRCRFPVKWEDGFGALLPHLPQLRTLAQLLAAHAMEATRSDRPGEALADITAILGIARHLGAEPVLIGQLVQYACLGHGLHALQYVMESTARTEAQSQSLYDALAGLDVYGSFTRALQTERCLGLWGFDFARRDPEKLAMLAGPKSEPAHLFALRVWPIAKPLLNMDEVVYLRTMGRQVALAGQQHRLTRREWDEERLRLPWYAALSRLLIPALTHASNRRDETVARLALVEWAHALHAYKQRLGQYPESLEQAAQSFGEALPHDPFSEGAFHYRRQGNGYLLYSFGANGRDDAGRNDGTQHPILRGAGSRRRHRLAREGLTRE